MNKMVIKFICVLCLIWIDLAETAYADYKDDIGFYRLQTELGDTMPAGIGIEVTQIEPRTFYIDPPSTDPPGPYMPDIENGEFRNPDKQFQKMTGDPNGVTGTSGHATTVGQYFYGNSVSIAPEVLNIAVYESNHWLQSGFLRITEEFIENWPYDRQPANSQRMVDNHSWVGKFTDDLEYLNSETLRRLDWVIETRESIQVVGLANSTIETESLLGSAFNVITVGRTDGSHPRRTTSIVDNYGDTVYENVRVKPDLVAPLNKTSYTTPVGSAAVAMLLEVGNGIANAGRSEVIRAILMAGAERATACKCTAMIGDFRADSGDRTANGLDSRFGTGQLNVYNSYHIINAGEKGVESDIGAQGYDYNPNFGGDAGPASYFFTADDAHSWFAASLVWNLKIDGGSYYSFNGSANNYNLDLVLLDITDSSSVVFASRSQWENTENIYVPLISGHQYELRVERGSEQAPFSWDYGLAWRMIPDPSGDGDGDGLPDSWEVDNGLDPIEPTDAMNDQDAGRNDGLTNLEEYCRGTDPNDPDTDGDQLDDGPEFVLWGDSCTDSDGDGLPNLIDPDSDNDGIDDGAEKTYWGDTWNADPDVDGKYNLIDPDSDNDGHLDGTEISNGSDPADPQSFPVIHAVPALNTTGFLLGVLVLALLGVLFVKPRV